MNVEGQGAIVTGGGSGLGKATAIALANAGARVLVVDREDSGAAVAKEIGAQFARADVTDENALQAAFAKAPDARIVVNTAGMGGPPIRTAGRKGAYPLDVFRRIVEVNLVGAFNVARLAAAQMSSLEPLDRGERGVIVLVSSVNAQDAPVGTVAYTASKAGVEGMTLAIARDLAPRGVRCVTIAPGNFDTPMLHLAPKEFLDQLIELVPFPNDRFGDPADFARLALSICENVMLNGEVIRLDGAVRHAQHR
ncbi:MAG TPA: SDR family NAD(P)-dependent oxidoreductase [Nevskiaceae bacterium]|nr:SDR family NAD(P)-dependent oxidoreductase [Nevskiaceae bacterium]